MFGLEALRPKQRNFLFLSHRLRGDGSVMRGGRAFLAACVERGVGCRRRVASADDSLWNPREKVSDAEIQDPSNGQIPRSGFVLFVFGCV